MDTSLIKEIVKLEDEKNYLYNILEAGEETGKDVEDIIRERLYKIHEKLTELEA